MPKKRVKITVSRGETRREGPAPPLVHIVGANERFSLVVLSAKLCEFDTHWSPSENHTIACIKPRTRCRGCITRMTRRYAAFLQVFAYVKNKQLLLHLTQQTADQIALQLGGEPLRGSTWSVQRENGQKRAALLMTKVGRVADETKLPAEIDPTPIILRMWGMEEDKETTGETS